MNFRVAILILKMEESKQYFQHMILHHFKKGKNVTGMQKKICTVYREGAMTDQMCQDWFMKFYATDFLLHSIHSWADYLKLMAIKSMH